MRVEAGTTETNDVECIEFKAGAGAAVTASESGRAVVTYSTATPLLAAASQSVLATGAAHTVDDVITVLQTLGLCKQS